MKNYILFLAMCAFQFISFGQFGITLKEHNNTCGINSCEGSIFFLFSTASLNPITYTHFYGTTTFSSGSGSGGQGITGLCAGSYNFHFEDTTGQTYDTTIVITEYEAFEAELMVTKPNTNNLNCDGEVIPIAITGGIAPFSIVDNYVFNCYNYFDVFEPNSLCSGSYYTFVKDSVGCESVTPCISTQFLSTVETIIDHFEITFQADILKVSEPFDQLCIYNLSGQIVLESSGAEQSIYTNELVTGIYIVSIVSKGKVYNQKVVKS
ncbi:hypothetical protein DNU06_09190 [Putridiphycobacter roseus]|uniref:Secretion system C-terminal sorting domain-containing protein n=1 Tax=Putridiphycobacter roseus TaxID=2219161 RepID=A0A2W1NMN2_9FLAO|nr:T9SS type A sorting domain-containing protein [Putridiphycobacter roseus]PZE16922.1 hypothetical protein DNU06_09190 [Putridiphycobacter roseus]